MRESDLQRGPADPLSLPSPLNTNHFCLGTDTCQHGIKHYAFLTTYNAHFTCYIFKYKTQSPGQAIEHLSPQITSVC